MDGTRQVLGKRRLNRLVDVRMLLADLARKMEREIMGDRDALGRIKDPPPLPEAESIMAYLKVIDTLGKYVEKREIEALEARVKALKAERDRAVTGPAQRDPPPCGHRHSTGRVCVVRVPHDAHRDHEGVCWDSEKAQPTGGPYAPALAVVPTPGGA